MTNADDLNTAVTRGGYIKLGSAISSGIRFVVPNVVLDLNGYTLTSTHSQFAFGVVGSLTIRDSSTKKTGTVSASGSNGGVLNQGTFTLESGTITNNNFYGVYNNGGTVNMSGGTINGNSYGVKNNGMVNMSGGTITGGYYGVDNVGTMTMSGGTITGTEGQDISNKAINKLTMTGGTLSKDPYLTLTYNGQTKYYFNLDDLRAARAAITEGTVTIGVPPAISTLTSSSGASMLVLDAAFDVANNGDTVQLLDDVNGGSTLNGNKEITLDLNGHTLSSTSGYAISVAKGSTLNINGNTEGSTFTVTTGAGIELNAGANLNIDGGTYNKTNYSMDNGFIILNKANERETINGNSVAKSDYRGKITLNNITATTATGFLSGITDSDTADGMAYISGYELEVTGGSYTATSNSLPDGLALFELPGVKANFSGVTMSTKSAGGVYASGRYDMINTTNGTTPANAETTPNITFEDTNITIEGPIAEVSPWFSSAISLAHGNVAQIKSGTYTIGKEDASSSAYGLYVYSSNGAFIIDGGEFINNNTSEGLLRFDPSSGSAATYLNGGTPSAVISGGSFTGTLTNTAKTSTSQDAAGRVKVKGGTYKNSDGTTANVSEYVPTGYEIDKSGNIAENSNNKWFRRSGDSSVYDYGTEDAVILSATLASDNDSINLKRDTDNDLFGIPSESYAYTDASDANDHHLAIITVSGSAMTVKPETGGVVIAGTSFAGSAQTLSVDDDTAVTVNATKNSLANITGGGGNDSIKVGARNSTLNGDGGNDTLDGNSGDDLFIYTSGKDVISNYTYGDDTVSITSSSAPAISFDPTQVKYDGTDLFISIADDNNLTFKSTSKVDLVHSTGTYHYRGATGGIERIEFGDGISLGGGYTTKNFDGRKFEFTTINASNVTLVGGLIIRANDESSSITGAGTGGVIYGGAGNDILNGAANAASLTLNGGAGDDSLVGGSGYNVFVYTEGNDKIKDYHDGDLVNVNNSVNLANAEFSLSDDNFILGFGSGDSLTLEKVASVTSGVSIQSGSSSKNIYVYKKDSIARNKSITLTSGFTAESLNFAAGDNYDTINAVAVGHAISIDGNDNNNVIFGSKQGGTLYGGAGKDKLDVTERDSGKTFVFKYTEGKDTVSGFVAGDKLEITADKIGEITKAKSSRSDTRLAFTFNTSKSDVLTFNSEDEIGSVSINGSDAYLTKDGIVSIGGSNSASLNLFASARGKIDLTEAPYASASLNAVDASEVKKQSVTLIGGTQGGSFTFAGNNKKKDLFEYNGGNVSISGYEAGVDRLDLNTAALGTFSVSGGNVSLTTGLGTVVLESMQGNEVLLHHAESKRSSFTKMVFKDTGVIFNKEKRPTAATVSGSYNISSDLTASTVKKIFVADGADNISITAGDRNKTTLDASVSNGGVTLTGGAKNDKLIGNTDAADTFVYTAGKDIIQNYSSNDTILLGSFASSLTSAKINAGKRSIKFKFSNKNALTVKPTKGSTLGSALNISEFNSYTYAKNAIAQGSNASLTSEFSGSYRLKNSGVNNVDGSRVEKNLTFRGTSADETLSGGTKKTTFKGGGGNDAFTGGSGNDIFFYAKGNSGNTTIADFDFNKDKLKIASGTITKISTVSGGIKFDMNKGKSSANVGSFTIGNIIEGYDDDGKATASAKKAIIKANNNYYWFAEVEGKDASGESYAEGALITSVSKVSKSDTTGYAVIDLGYSSNLVNAGVAYKTEQTLTKLSNNDD